MVMERRGEKGERRVNRETGRRKGHGWVERGRVGRN
jgi:hypothetical protein